MATRRKRIYLLAFALSLAAAAHAYAAPGGPAPLRLFVSPKGNDAATGLAPAPGQGNVGPFATLKRAREELRARKAAGQLPAGAEVMVRAGTYELPETFVLGPEDSGTPGKPVAYRAYLAEKPALVGARILTGFRPYKGPILQCDLKALGLGSLRSRQLFFRGERMTLARTPNADPKDPHGGTWGHVMGVEGKENKREFTYPAEIDHPWANPKEAEVCIFPSWDWAWSIVPVAGVDHEAKKISLAGNTGYAMAVGDRFYVQNLMEELDAPGEWYLDRASATLYFWPPAEIGSGQVLAPLLSTIVSLEGASHVEVRGFTVEACDGDAVTVKECRESVVSQCTVRNCGRWGISISGGSKSGASGNDVYATGAGGISVNGGDRKTLAPGENYADNNYIHHVAAFIRTYNTGININGVGNRATHNLIHDVPHAGIALGGNDNRVELNNVHHTNLQSADTGGIYFCSRDWTQRGNIIRHNIFHHLGGFGKTNSWQPVRGGKVQFHYPGFTWGIYLDDPTTGTLVYGNILYDVPICGLHNHGGRDNTWENNVIVDCPALNAGMLSPNWSEWPPITKRLHDAVYPGSPYLLKYPELAEYKDENPEAMTGVKFLRNIVCYTKEGTAWLRGEQGKGWGENAQLLYGLNMRKEDFARNEWDYNTVHCPQGLDLRVSLGLSPEPRKMLSWEDWRALGVDTHSQLADPLFVDAAGRDFRLQKGSPALKLGFKEIPVAQIGPYADPRRASWPVVEVPGVSALGNLVTVREVELPQYALLPAREFAARDGAPNFFAKLAAGQPVRVAYFGGGIAPREGWRAGFLKWLRDRYPKVKIDEISADINDCVRGSGFSIYRFGRDVLAQKPDLVLVDFASDDFQTDPQAIWAVAEGLVRQAQKADPTLDLCFVYSFRAGFEKEFAEGKSPSTISAYEKVAEHYGIPSVSMAYRVAQLARDGKLLIQATPEEEKAQPEKAVFSRDGVRPQPAGNQVYVDALAAGFGELAKNATPRPHADRKPFYPENLEKATQAPITQAMLEGNWKRLGDKEPLREQFKQHFADLWETSAPGAKITFKFKGTGASLFNLIGPDTGRAIITVDGKPAGIRQQVDPWCTYQRLAALPVADGLPDGVHTVTVELHPDAPDRSAPMEAARKQPNFNMALFQGVALRFAWIRVVGEVVE